MKEKKLKKLIKNRKIIQPKYHTYTFKDDTNLLHWAAFFDNIELLKKIIKKCDINKKGGKYKSTPLFFAAYNSNYKSMLILIENKANIKCINSKGYNLLHLFAKMDDILGYLFLKRLGLSENQKNLDGNLPLDIAKKYKSKEIIGYYKCYNRKSILQKLISYLFSSKITAFSFCVILFYANVNLVYIFSLCILKNIKNKNFVKFNTNFLICLCLFLIFKEEFYKSFILLDYFKKISLENFVKKKKPLKIKSIKKLIQKYKYNLQDFCIYCLNVKSNLVHCKYCNKCIDFKGYHCFYLGRCISYNELPKVFICLFLFINVLYDLENPNVIFLAVSFSFRIFLFFLFLFLKF